MPRYALHDLLRQRREPREDRLSVRAVAVAMALLAGVGLAGCGSALDGSVARHDSAGLSVQPGQIADYTAFVINRSGSPITLESAQLIPMPAFPMPRSGGHAGVERGVDFVAADTGWPPDGFPASRLAPLVGYRIAPHDRASIVYTTMADRPGNYAVRGVRLRARVDGSDQTVDALGASLTCVFPHVGRHGPSCPLAAQRRLERAIEH